MATWQDILALQMPRAEEVSDGVLTLQFEGCEPNRSQKVFLFHDVLKPDLEMIRISSAIALASEINAETVMQGLGNMLIGGLSYSPYGDNDGIISLGITLPLMFLDLSESAFFYVYLGILARDADRVEQGIFGTDRF